MANSSSFKVTYIGWGYKIIRYTEVSINESFQNNIGVKFGSWFMKYDLIEPNNKKQEAKGDINDIDSFYNLAITNEFGDIRNLDDNYKIEQAIEDGCFVISHTKVYNDNLYHSFMEHYRNQESAFIRVIQLTIEGDFIISDLMYDSKTDEIILITDSSRDKFSDVEDQIIKLSKYEKTAEYDYHYNLYWILYNGEVSDSLFETDDVYVVTPLN